ncbi:hypothetical protein [Metabacillus iocasae]|uniref:DUF4025 domain-containing protein n=1 Tax=Priestia iocasae TaxID=2291674 RepID=A0ABS2QP37_9BACI|nr:hypothetical protein [Metabacillus iocasae]MBM7701216.1 hypothetical protein [Metabacillus iocasae]
MKDKKHPQHQYEYDQAGEQETFQQLMDSYASGVVGDGYMAQPIEDVEAKSDSELYE